MLLSHSNAPTDIKAKRYQQKRGMLRKAFLFLVGRDDRTRTGDPYVPNVVRYQLRYIPMRSHEEATKHLFLFCGCKGSTFF